MSVKKDNLIEVKSRCRMPMGQRPPAISQETIEEIELQAKEFGFLEVNLLPTSQIVTAQWVVLKCRYGCANFNTSWCCPPATPDLATTRDLLAEYELALLLVAENRNQDFYRNTSEKRRAQIKQWKATIALERRLFLMGYYKAFGMPAETCALCKECAYPKQCKFPNEKRPSVEACSIDVFQTLRNLGRSAGLARKVEDSFHSYSVILLM
jgi:predicted metal-binding protein